MNENRPDKDPKRIEEAEMLRYLSNEMSDGERHAFEKRLEKDPFAYEAVEGFENTDPAEIRTDLNQMRLQMQPWRRRPVMMWKIAAVVALLVVAGLSAWVLTDDSGGQLVENGEFRTEPPIAMKDEEVAEEQEAPPPVAESAKPDTDEIADEPENTSLPSSAGQAAGPAHRVETLVIADQPEERVAFEADEAAKEPGDDYPLQEEAIAEDLREGTFDEQVAEKPEAQQDQLQEALAEKEEARPTAGHVAVVSESATEKKASGAAARSARSTADKATEESPPIETAAPDMGWDEFNRYVKANQVKSSEMVRGEVRLSFVVDGQGNPTQIEVVQSLCEACDTEAVRLLTESGKWSYYNHISGAPKSLVEVKIRK